jgi:putative transposase
MCWTSWFSRGATPRRRRGFFRRLLKGLEYIPRVVITDKLASYGVAHRALLPSVEHRRSKYLNNRAENSHPTHPPTGTGGETLHLARPRAAVPLRSATSPHTFDLDVTG